MLKQFFKLFYKVLPYPLLMAFSGDLLYLYHAGYWYDPYKFIEILELVILYLVIPWAIIQIIIIYKKGV